MSFEDIVIYRDFPVINGYVIVPPVQERDKTRVPLAAALVAIPGSATTRLSRGSGLDTGSFFGAQKWLRLPGLLPGTSYAVDPVVALATIPSVQGIRAKDRVQVGSFIGTEFGNVIAAGTNIG